ncbi:MAG: hypothetical protein EOS09_33180 [Mesorhizobium sp.]|nr:MAG: hypothetical protein EOS09_33180 [Mesorhizobium sp.]
MRELVPTPKLHTRKTFVTTDGCFAWPTTRDQVAVSLTKAQLSLLLDGIDWRRPSKIYRPRLVGLF